MFHSIFSLQARTLIPQPGRWSRQRFPLRDVRCLPVAIFSQKNDSLICRWFFECPRYQGLIHFNGVAYIEDAPPQEHSPQYHSGALPAPQYRPLQDHKNGKGLRTSSSSLCKATSHSHPAVASFFFPHPLQALRDLQEAMDILSPPGAPRPPGGHGHLVGDVRLQIVFSLQAPRDLQEAMDILVLFSHITSRRFATCRRPWTSCR